MNTYRGFTLVELLVVILIIGILAAVAVPRFSNSKDRAMVAQMKSDLRNLATMQEAYHVEHRVYTVSFSPAEYSVSSGVTGPTITLTADGWWAYVGHVQLAKTCALFVGSTPLAPAATEGVPACTP